MAISQEKHIENITKQLRVAMNVEGITATDIARKEKTPAQTVRWWINHPESLDLRKWSILNKYLHLDPALFNIAAGFVRGGNNYGNHK